MVNTIYIVAGERNMVAAPIHKGLYANVGQTSRDVEDRLRDDDYKRKAAGGKWIIIYHQPVGDSVTDKMIHPYLKQHPDVVWDAESDNTEEFFFKDDPGDGSVAVQIIISIVKQFCLPLLQEENKKLQAENDLLRTKVDVTYLTSLEKTAADLDRKNKEDAFHLESIKQRLSEYMQESCEFERKQSNLQDQLSQMKDSKDRMSIIIGIFVFFFALGGAFCGGPWLISLRTDLDSCNNTFESLSQSNEQLTSQVDKSKETIRDLEGQINAMNAKSAPKERKSSRDEAMLSLQRIPSTCQALSADANNTLQCESDGKLFTLKGRDVDECELSTVSFRQVDKGIVASCRVAAQDLNNAARWGDRISTVVEIQP